MGRPSQELVNDMRRAGFVNAHEAARAVDAHYTTIYHLGDMKRIRVVEVGRFKFFSLADVQAQKDAIAASRERLKNAVEAARKVNLKVKQPPSADAAAQSKDVRVEWEQKIRRMVESIVRRVVREELRGYFE